jgi:exodeoxyribonuclease VII small subunit
MVFRFEIAKDVFVSTGSDSDRRLIDTPQDRSTSPPHTSPDVPPFEQSLLELTQIADRLDQQSEGLESALQDFERGVHLLRRCYQYLATAEQRVEELVSLDPLGQAQFRPVPASTQPTDSAVTKSAGSAKRARSKSSTSAATTEESATKPQLPFFTDPE